MKTRLFNVYEIDEDDEGCVRLYVNSTVPFTDEAGERLAKLIEAVGGGPPLKEGVEPWGDDIPADEEL